MLLSPFCNPRHLLHSTERLTICSTPLPDKLTITRKQYGNSWQKSSSAAIKHALGMGRRDESVVES